MLRVERALRRDAKRLHHKVRHELVVVRVRDLDARLGEQPVVRRVGGRVDVRACIELDRQRREPALLLVPVEEGHGPGKRTARRLGVSGGAVAPAGEWRVRQPEVPVGRAVRTWLAGVVADEQLACTRALEICAQPRVAAALDETTCFAHGARARQACRTCTYNIRLAAAPEH